jgi:hypothetical protein
MSIHEDKIKDHDVFVMGRSRKNHADRMLMVIVPFVKSNRSFRNRRASSNVEFDTPSTYKSHNNSFSSRSPSLVLMAM